MFGFIAPVIMILFGIYTKITTHPGYADAKEYWKTLVVLGSIGLLLKIVIILLH